MNLHAPSTWIFVLSLLIAVLAVILHGMWVDGTEFNWSKKEVAA